MKGRGPVAKAGPHSHDDYIRTGKAVPLNAGSRCMARDPAEVYEGKEARSCAGCINETVIELAGTQIKACERNKPYGRKCRDYVEREPIRAAVP